MSNYLALLFVAIPGILCRLGSLNGLTIAIRLFFIRLGIESQ